MIGIVPAAGRARRLGSPGASKELSPVYARPERPGEILPVCYRLLDAFREAAIPRATVVLREDKTDLLDRLATLESDVPRLRILTLDDSPSAAFTVAVGTRKAGDADVALGFPDVLWEGPNAFVRLFEELRRRDADVVLGLFPPPPDYPTQRVALDPGGRVRALRDPGSGHGAEPVWTLAVWRPTLSRYLEAAVDARYGNRGPETPDAGELDMRGVFRGALDAGLRIHGLPVSDRPFLDVGDPVRLAKARRLAELAARD